VHPLLGDAESLGYAVDDDHRSCGSVPAHDSGNLAAAV
jgi:hypothetical protein